MSNDRLILTVERQFQQKAEHRRELAQLPFEEKLKRLVKLQARAYVIGSQAGRKPYSPWGTTTSQANKPVSR